MSISILHRHLIFVALTAATLAHAQVASDVRMRIQLPAQPGRSPAPHAVLWLKPLDETQVPPFLPEHHYTLLQKNRMFTPHLLVIPVGSIVDFPNADPFFHNVFSLFDGKRFDLGLYEAGTTKAVTFSREGISFIFCNIHAEMSAVVIALATPYYAISNARGDVTIADVPPGRYQLQIFHAGVAPDALHAMTREITIAPGQANLGTFTLAESDVTVEHKNKYGRDYDRPQPDSPAYARP